MAGVAFVLRHSSFVFWLIGSLTHWLIGTFGTLAHWHIGSLAHLAHWLIGTFGSLAHQRFLHQRHGTPQWRVVAECGGHKVHAHLG